MNRTTGRGIALAVLLAGLVSSTTLALPSFSDRDIAAGNLNPTDTIMVMEIQVTRGGSEDVTISSITLRNEGTADNEDMERLIVKDGGDVLGETDNLSGITSSNGITIPLSYHLDDTTQYLEIFVTIGTNVEGGETVELQALIDYTSDGTPGTSVWISDLTGETIRRGGFDQIEDNSGTALSLNPNDELIVQTATFMDDDANSSQIAWQDDPIVKVENIGSATGQDIAGVAVAMTINGQKYESVQTRTFDGDKQVVFDRADFPADEFPAWPDPDPDVDDDHGVVVEVAVLVGNKNAVTDRRTVRTKVTLYVSETGQGDFGTLQEYAQSATCESTHTIRRQGYERIVDQSQSLSSGTASNEETIVQSVRVFDDDANEDKIQARRVYIRNTGTATGDEIERIDVVVGSTTVLTLPNATYPDLDDFRTGAWYNLDGFPDEMDDDDQLFKFQYTIGTAVDGHTLQPAVRIEGREPFDSGSIDDDYVSDQVTYPDELGLYEPGFEFVENVTPPSGGTAYSGQFLLAQTVRLEDRDEDDDDVVIDPVVVRNAGNATGNPDVTKIVVRRQDEEDGDEVVIGQSSDLSGFRTGGVRVDIDNDAIVQDAPGGAEVFLLVYLQIADPEEMVAGRTIQLETRVIHTENGSTYDKSVQSNQWVLETNHRPVVDFTVEVGDAGTASIGPKATFTYEDTLQFNGTASDPDPGDAIDRWRWSFGDGSGSNQQNPTHTYPNGGTFDVTLTAWDSRGVSGSKTKTIEVEGPPNEPPAIEELTAEPTNPAVDQDVAFAVTVTDPDQPEGTAFEYGWDFGDETTSTVAAPTHSYAEDGDYTVTVTVTDAQGATDTATVDLTVGNDPPTLTGVTATPSTAGTGEVIEFRATGYADPDEDEADRYEWSFGDDTTREEGGPVETHVYTVPGTYTISVIAVDARGARSQEFTVDVTITGPARTVMFAYPNPAAAAATFTYYLPEGGTDPVLRIYSLTGELVLEQELAADATTFEWNLQTTGGTVLPNGLYLCFVTVAGADRSEVFRLLIVR